MKKSIVLFLATLVTLSTVNAIEITCTASNKVASTKDGQIVIIGDEVTVPIHFKGHALLTNPQTWTNLGHSKMSVSFQQDNEYSKQTYLQMELDDITSTVYDLKPSLYMLEKNGIRFQCLVQEGA